MSQINLVVEEMCYNYSNFDGYERVFTQSLCLCCDLCSKLCDCNKCTEKHNTFVFPKK